MADDSELKLILRIQGQQEAADLEKKMESLRQKILATGQTVAANDPAMKALASQYKSMGDRVDELHAKFGRGGNNGLAYGVQGATRAFQDFTSSAMNGGFTAGLSAITNNVEQVGLGFGRMAGLSAEAASMLASFGTLGIVGLQLVIPAVKSLVDYFGLLPEKIDPNLTAMERLEGAIKKLNENPIKTLESRNQLEALESDLKRAKDATEAYGEARGLKGKTQTESEGKIKGAIGEANSTQGRSVIDELKKAELQTPQNQAQVNAAKEEYTRTKTEIQKFYRTATGESSITPEQLEKAMAPFAEKIRKAETEADNAAGRKAGALYRGATDADPGKAAEGIRKLAEALEKIGQKDLAETVRNSSPEALKKKKIEATQDFLDKDDEEQFAAEDKANKDRIKKQQAERNALKEQREEAEKFNAEMDKKDKAEVHKAADPLAKALASGMTADLGQGDTGFDKDKIRARLKESGVNVSETIVDAVFEEMNKDFKDDVKKKALELGGTIEQATKVVTDEAWKKRSGRDPNEDAKAQMRHDVRADDQMAGRIAEGSGALDPTTMYLMQARANRTNFRTTGQWRKFSRMTGEEQANYVAAGNDQADAQAKAELTRNYLRAGYTRDPKMAAAAAEKVVNTARSNLNGETGDMQTRQFEKQMEKTDKLIERFDKLIDNGVYVKMRE